MAKTRHSWWNILVIWLVAISLIVFAIWVVIQERREAKVLSRRCALLCDPYVVESCGKDARTATCKTIKGYAVRMLDKNGTIVSEF